MSDASTPDAGRKHSAETVAQQMVVQDPTPLPKLDLHDAHAIRRELGSVYRAMRAGQLSLNDGAKLTYVLMAMMRMFERSELQRRLEQIERTLTVKGEIREISDRQAIR